MPIFEFHSAVLDSDHRADVSGLGVLDHQTQLHRMLGGTGPAGVRIVGKDVGAIAISHRVIVGVTCVLLTRDTAEGIANGTITVVLRRWDAPRVEPGRTQRTLAGTIRVDVAAAYLRLTS